MKPCPFCAEEIQDQATVCKHCGKNLSTSASLQRAGFNLMGAGCGIMILTVVGLFILIFLAVIFA